ncbi:MAG: universal stress protein [Ilumatobacteraceae bacterium]
MSSQQLPAVDCDARHVAGRVLVGFRTAGGFDAALDWATIEAAARCSRLQVVDSPTMLVDEADGADLLVLAVSPSESARLVLLGSLARKAARRSPCPVVIVRGSRPSAIRRIVVGVDGSSAAAAAIDWACDEACLHRASVQVIHSRERDVGRAEAGCLLDLAVNECRHRTNGIVTGVLTEGAPADALIAASVDADIVAVGSRGRSGFRTRLFGSVALSVAEGADCPVAVTHPQPRLD